MAVECAKNGGFCVGPAAATRRRLFFCLAKCGGSGLELDSVACLFALANELRLSGSNLLQQKGMESGVEQTHSA